MPNIWKENQNVNENPNRNNFDLRFQNHLTMKIGTLYPIMCKEVNPGDSFKIDTAFGLKFMPLVFPVQSQMKAHVHYFYVRNKNLWKNWENFIQGLPNDDGTTPVHPYIDKPSSFWRTGTLADYIDNPTTLVGTHSFYKRYETTYYGYSFSRGGTFVRINDDGSASIGINSEDIISTNQTILFPYNCQINQFPVTDMVPLYSVVETGASSGRAVIYTSPVVNEIDKTGKFRFSAQLPASSYAATGYLCFIRAPRGYFSNTYRQTGNYRDFRNLIHDTNVKVSRSVEGTFANNATKLIEFTPTDSAAYLSLISLVNYWNGYKQNDLNPDPQETYDIVPMIVFSNYNFTQFLMPFPHELPTKTKPNFFTGQYFIPSVMTDVVDTSETITPFGNDADPDQYEPLSALPYRAYESIFRAYYMNTQNQKFYVDGNEVYNRYNTTLEDGADTTDYHLFQRNYELDYLTSAMPSPQFGTAPLVGMTALGNVTIEDENGITTARAEIDDDGTISKVVLTSPAASVEHARTAMNIAASGMSINDFRAVNSFQRFLETTLRKGYKYKDFIEGHFGQSPEYKVLDMPEFIGGTSEDVSVQTVSNTTSGSDPLGQFAGVANCFGSNRNSITHYCDDYGFIVGIMCIVPTPAYSQLLPKHFLHSKQLDYYFPEFATNGLQPITYREVCPVQSYQEWLDSGGTTGSLTDTFGYQRPNYDLISYTDQVHGLFRTQMRDYLVNRIFSARPELGSEFLSINPAEVNDIFAVNDPSEDTIVGQVIIDIKAKRPVPRVTIPSLGK